MQFPATVELPINRTMKFTMKYALVAILIALLGCTDFKPAARTLTTQPAFTYGKPADILVRVQEFQGPEMRDMNALPMTVPAGAKLIASAEAAARFGEPFSSTVVLPDQQQIRIGGEAHQSMPPDKIIRLELGFSDCTLDGQR